MFYINFRANSFETFTLLEIEGYELAKKNYNRLVDSGYKDVTLSDFEGEIIFETNNNLK